MADDEQTAPGGMRTCPYPDCRSVNPADAQFCRRCSREMAGAYAAGADSPVEASIDQPLTIAEESTAPVVPPPGAHPAGFATISDKPEKLWYAGTLVYTSAGLIALFFWLLLGDFAISIRDRSVGPVVQLMLRLFKTDDFTMSILLSTIPTAITLVLSPVISYKSDRLRSKWGRRIPFLIVPTPIAALAMIGLAFCPQIAGWLQHVTGDAMTHKTALLTTFGVFWTVFEIAVIIAGSVFNGLINDVVPRPVLGRFYAMFRQVSLIDGMIFQWGIQGHAEQHFTLIFVWIAAVFGIGFMVMCYMVKEGEPPAEAAPANDHRAGGFIAAVKVYMRECYSKPHYLWIFAAFTLTALAAQPINGWSIMYAKKLGMEVGAWDPNGTGFGDYRLGLGGVQGLTYFFSLFLAYPIGMMVDKFHPLRVALVAMTLYGISCFVGWSLIFGPASFGWAMLAHGVLSGCYFTASAALAQVLLPRARFAQFASAGVVVTQLAQLVYNPVLGWILKKTGSNYSITFLLSGVFSTLSVILLIVIYRKFMAMGGPAGYVAPLASETSRGFDVVPPTARH